MIQTGFEPLAVAHELLLALEAPYVPPDPEHERYWGWDSYPLYDFFKGMAAVGPAEGRSFLDVGAGVGSKLLLAHRLGFRPYGIERHQPYIDAGRRLFGEQLEIEQADAFEYEDYGRFDVVYCFRPCKTEEDQDTLNRRITSRLHAGAVFFSAGGPWPTWLPEQVGEQVWRQPS